MASAFSHALVGAGLALVWCAHAPRGVSYLRAGGPSNSLDEIGQGESAIRREHVLKRAPLWCAALAASPDLDVIMHAFVRYEDALGHRGAFHSPAIYLLVALGAAALCGARLWLGSLVFVTLLSHSLLDMLTTGGLGIAMLWPASAERFFFPWRVIPVSPLSVSAFFGDWGRRVLLSELTWALPFFTFGFVYGRVARRHSVTGRRHSETGPLHSETGPTDPTGASPE